jgi:FtsP/CotA-like multicopper oxidase with cupredoxin domain
MNSLPARRDLFYHSHDHPDRQQNLGLYGALIICST